MKLDIMDAQAENTAQAGLTERSQFAMVKNMKMTARNCEGHLSSQMKENLCFLSQTAKKRCGGERTVN